MYFSNLDSLGIKRYIFPSQFLQQWRMHFQENGMYEDIKKEWQSLSERLEILWRFL